MKKIVVVTAEESASLHAYHLIQHLKQLDNYSFIGTGSEILKEDVELIATPRELSFVGFEEPLKIVKIIRIYQQLKKIITHSDGVLLIDYPGINLRLACYAKKLHKNVCYFVAPQVWAWGQWRTKKIAKCVDRLVCLFPFEEAFFRNYGVNARFFGHPLVEKLELFASKEREYLVLMPGSRDSEVKSLLPVCVEAATILEKFNFPTVLITAPSVDKSLYANLPKWIERVGFEKRYDYMGKAIAAIAASGTATLELAILEVPTVVVYKTSPLSWAIGKRLVKVNFLSIVNILSEREVFPELLQDMCRGDKVARKLARFLEDENYKKKLIKHLKSFEESIKRRKLLPKNCGVFQ